MKKLVLLLVIISILCLAGFESSAQCAMCKQVAEDASDLSGQAVGLGLNNGIKYLLVIPYILFGVFLTVFFRKKR